MAVEDPGTLTVTCDVCGEQTEMDTTEYSGDPPTWGVDRSTLEQNGWADADNGIVCPACKGDSDGDE